MKARFLKSLYPRVIDGLPLIGTPSDVVLKYTDDENRLDADGMIRYYARLSGVTGFFTGLPGFLLMPITIPADLLGNAAVQLHMSAAFAVAGGFDPEVNEVRDQCIACLLAKVGDPGENEEGEEVSKRTGIKLGERVLRFGANRVGKILTNRIGRRFTIRGVPILGGLMGGGSDAILTNHVGKVAEETFLGTTA